MIFLLKRVSEINSLFELFPAAIIVVVIVVVLATSL